MIRVEKVLKHSFLPRKKGKNNTIIPRKSLLYVPDIIHIIFYHDVMVFILDGNLEHAEIVKGITI